MSLGIVYAMIGAAIAVGVSGVGSAIGVQRAGQAASGLLSKEPKGFVKLLILVVLPSTQCIYGFVVAFMIFGKTIMPGAELAAAFEAGKVLSADFGLSALFLSIPVGLVGLFSAIAQGNAAASAINLVGKQPKLFVNSIILVTLVEMFALFGFLISLLGITGLDPMTSLVEPAVETVGAFLPVL